MKSNSIKYYCILLSINLIYSLSSIFSKWTSSQEQFSFEYFLGICTIVGILGIYAILWQQILKYIPLSDAYMFKGTTIVFVLLLSWIIWGEAITINNCIGTLFIISGIILFAKE